jgi:hypothetical protein
MPRRSIEQRNRDELRLTIWALIVRYSNDGEGFRELIRSCAEWIGGLPADLDFCADIADGWEIEELGEKYRAATKDLLRWLTNPTDKELGRKCIAFLDEHGTQIKMKWEYVNYDPNGPEPILMLLEYPGEMGSVMSPICRFIKDQIDLRDESEYPLLKAFPIAPCKRPGCDGFKLVKKELKRGVLCSVECKAKWRKFTASKERKKKYAKKNRKDRKQQEKGWQRVAASNRTESRRVKPLAQRAGDRSSVSRIDKFGA